MQIKTGIDIIEVNRIKEAIQDLDEKFLKRVYTNYEIEYCNSKNNMKYQHFAARFAAKEAVFKAISNKLKSKYDISWTDIEIKNDENGKPMFFIDKLNKCDIISKDISMSHIKDYAIASVSILLEN
ncbi:MAG: holo-ACP synthase [Clostridia bacterium]|jgi:holo-[acyl-carrier protein] synthase|nr:holo-[acyl-carrier-protein] synthase [Clostridium sp. CAG:571]HJJ06495.1 holo-ACP synthase [Clostridiaceae bacterium]HJJ14005.1 holo-ACP synthase [Clostridiaceae bacterium]